jgi:hypothetical protein
LTFYALDADGDISPAQTLTVVVTKVREVAPTAESKAEANRLGICIVGGGGILIENRTIVNMSDKMRQLECASRRAIRARH